MYGERPGAKAPGICGLFRGAEAPRQSQERVNLVGAGAGAFWADQRGDGECEKDADGKAAKRLQETRGEAGSSDRGDRHEAAEDGGILAAE